MPFTIRPATAKDRKLLLQMWAKLDHLQATTVFGGNDKGKSKLHQRLARQLTTVDFGFALFAWDEKSPAGCIAAHLFDKPEAEQTPVGILYNLWVEPEYRRQGLASELAKAAEQGLIERGAKSLQVAWRTQGPGQQFWQKQGYGAYEVMAAKLPESH